jgi:hypothetical protein
MILAKIDGRLFAACILPRGYTPDRNLILLDVDCVTISEKKSR